MHASDFTSIMFADVAGSTTLYEPPGDELAKCFFSLDYSQGKTQRGKNLSFFNRPLLVQERDYFEPANDWFLLNTLSC